MQKAGDNMAGIGTSVSVNDGLSSAFQTMTQSINICLSSFIQMQEATNQSVNATGINEARAALNNANMAAAQLSEELSEAGNKQQQFNNHVKNGDNALGNLTKKALGLVAAYASIQGVKGMLNLSDTLTQTTARLDMMNDGLQTTEELQNMIFQSAQKSRGSYQATADAVAKMGIMAKDAFGSNAELVEFSEQLNKQFTIAGTSSEGISAAMLQLTQAMGSGVLRGEELNSVFEQAPTIIQSIADYLDVPIGKIREMAADGEISASVVKNALLSAADETNAKFESMPMTWGQVATSIKNQAIVAFQPILTKLSEIANSERFNSFVNSIIGGLYAISNVAVQVFDALVSAGAFVYDNWDLIAPVIIGVATAMAFYNGILLAHNIIQGVTNTLKTIAAIRSVAHGAAITAEMTATTGMTAAQLTFNAALYACPLTWIILIIIALISVIYIVIAAINHFAGTSYSATGVIAGAFATLAAFIWNTVVGVINAVIQYLWSNFVEPFISIIEWVLNVANGGFNSFGDAVANLVGQIISWFLSLGKVVTKIIDSIFGTNWTSGLNSLQNEVLSWGKNENAITLNRNAPQINSRIAYSDAYDAGYKFGQGIDDKVSDFFGGNEASNPYGDATDYLGDIQNNTANGADSTEKIADAMEITEEDLKYLRDIAEREIIDRTVFQSLTVDMGGVTNTVNNMADLDGISDYLGDLITTTAASSMEG